MIDLDDTDRAILRELQKDGGLSAAALAKRVDMSQPATWRRVRRLTDDGVIQSRYLVLDREKLGFGVTVFLGVKLATKGRVSLEDFERAITAIPEVQLVQHVLVWLLPKIWRGVMKILSMLANLFRPKQDMQQPDNKQPLE